MAFKTGQIYGISGVSGAGKTTLVDLICGLNQPDTGDISFIYEKERVLTATHDISVGYVSQNCALFGENIFSNIALKENIDTAEQNKITGIIRDLNLGNLINKKKYDSSGSIRSDGSNLSGGERQRLSLARALFSDADVIILDEPTSALDDKNVTQVLKNLKRIKKGKILILISHSRKILQICDKVYKL